MLRDGRDIARAALALSRTATTERAHALCRSLATTASMATEGDEHDPVVTTRLAGVDPNSSMSGASERGAPPNMNSRSSSHDVVTTAKIRLATPRARPCSRSAGAARAAATSAATMRRPRFPGRIRTDPTPGSRPRQRLRRRRTGPGDSCPPSPVTTTSDSETIDSANDDRAVERLRPGGVERNGERGQGWRGLPTRRTESE